MVLPLIKPVFVRKLSTHANTCLWVSRSIRLRVRDRMDGSGGFLPSGSPRKLHRLIESATLHVMPRSLSMPSNKPTEQAAKVHARQDLGRRPGS